MERKSLFFTTDSEGLAKLYDGGKIIYFSPTHNAKSDSNADTEFNAEPK